jgi:hypothetical protein
MPPQTSSPRFTSFLIVGGCAVLIAASVSVYLNAEPRREKIYLSPDRNGGLRYDVAYAPAPPPSYLSLPIVPGGQAQIDPEEPVLGIVSEGRCRAYCLAAFPNQVGHVLNDMVDSTPITVAYCWQTRSYQVYTGPGREPLQMMSGGYENIMTKDQPRKSLLAVSGNLFFQESGKPVKEGTKFPYQTHPFKLTTWQEWKDSHPSTDVLIVRYHSRFR